MLNIVPSAIYTTDKAYVDFEVLNRIDSGGAFFVTRAKDNVKCEIVSTKLISQQD